MKISINIEIDNYQEEKLIFFLNQHSRFAISKSPIAFETYLNNTAYVSLLFYTEKDIVYYGSVTFFKKDTKSTKAILRYPYDNQNKDDPIKLGSVTIEVPYLTMDKPEDVVINFDSNQKKKNDNLLSINEFVRHVRLPDFYYHPIAQIRVPPNYFFYVNKSKIEVVDWKAIYKELMFFSNSMPTSMYDIADFINVILHLRYTYRSDRFGESFDNLFLTECGDCEDFSYACIRIFYSIKRSGVFNHVIKSGFEAYAALLSAETAKGKLAHMICVIKDETNKIIVPIEVTRLMLYESKDDSKWSSIQFDDTNLVKGLYFKPEDCSYFYKEVVQLIDVNANVYLLVNKKV